MLGQFVQGPVTTDVPGRVFTLPGNRGMGITLYSAGAVTKGQPMMVDFSSTADQEVRAVAPATMASQRLVVIALEAVAAATVGKFQFQGKCLDCDVETGVAAGDRLQLTNAETALEVDGSTTSTTHTTATCAMALEANATGSDASLEVWLYGKEAIIEAS